MMSENAKPEPDAESSQGGVFGNLPGSRPGPRSPRRDAKAKATGGSKPKARARAKAAPAAKAKQAPAARSQPPQPNVQGERAPAEAPPASEPGHQTGGLSDVAWAGIAVAAEAATIGVRFASRAIEAVRGNPERD
jgi:hypothetical protein